MQHPAYAFAEAQLNGVNLDVPAAPNAGAAEINLRTCATDYQFAARCDMDSAADYVQGTNRALSTISQGLALTVAQELQVQLSAMLQAQLLDLC